MTEARELAASVAMTTMSPIGDVAIVVVDLSNVDVSTPCPASGPGLRGYRGLSSGARERL